MFPFPIMCSSRSSARVHGHAEATGGRVHFFPNAIMVGCFHTECSHERSIRFDDDAILLAEGTNFFGGYASTMMQCCWRKERISFRVLNREFRSIAGIIGIPRSLGNISSDQCTVVWGRTIPA